MKIVSSLLALALLATVPAFAEDTNEEVSQVVSGDVAEEVAPAQEEQTPEENPVAGDLVPAPEQN